MFTLLWLHKGYSFFNHVVMITFSSLHIFIFTGINNSIIFLCLFFYIFITDYHNFCPNCSYIKTHQAIYQINFLRYTYSGAFWLVPIWIDYSLCLVHSCHPEISHSPSSWWLFSSFLCVSWIPCCPFLGYSFVSETLWCIKMSLVYLYL